MKPFSFLAKFLFVFILFINHFAFAFDGNYLGVDNSKDPHYLLAQQATGEDDSYDPFADYTEFDEASDEEADINFFKNGRFLTVGLVVGMRGFTENLNTLYGAAPTYGLFLSYFFDLRLALQLGYNTGDYNYTLQTTNNTPLTGSVNLTFIYVNLKYYLNTQNVTKGLADLNPYLIGGFSQVYRSYTFSSVDISSKEAATGVDGGFGLEIPILRRKAFFGIQATYHYVRFQDSNSYLLLPDGSQTTQKPSGQTYDVLGILGLNF